MKIILCFYRGRAHDAVALGTRLVTRRRGQPLADVPSHVAAVVVDDEGAATLSEAILSGIHSRPALPIDFAWSRTVDVPAAPLARMFWASQIGHRYRLVSIVLVILRSLLQWLGLDRDIGLVDNCQNSFICSTYAEQGLREGQFPITELLRKTGNDFSTPTRPNDLWRAVRDFPSAAEDLAEERR